MIYRFVGLVGIISVIYRIHSPNPPVFVVVFIKKVMAGSKYHLLEFLFVMVVGKAWNAPEPLFFQRK